MLNITFALQCEHSIRGHTAINKNITQQRFTGHASKLFTLNLITKSSLQTLTGDTDLTLYSSISRTEPHSISTGLPLELQSA